MMQLMKRVYSIVALTSVIAFASCNKDIVAPETAGNFTICANVPTKTVADGFNVNWTSGDRISLYHSVAGADSYVNDGAFSFVSGAEFTGTLAENLSSESYDWFAVYPYSTETHSSATAPVVHKYDPTKAEIVIGGRAFDPQIQNGNGSTGHVAGIVAPLYGSAKDVPAQTTPLVAMHQAAVVLSVDVKNSIENDIVVKSVELTAPKEIVGQYTLNLCSQQPVYAPEYEGSTSNVAKLVVKGGAALATDESASFFVLAAPFKALAGDKISLKVVTNVGTVVKEVTLQSDMDFAAGTVKHMRFAYDQSSQGSYAPISEPETVSGTFQYTGEVTSEESDPKLTLVTESGLTIVQSKGTTAYKSGTNHNWPKPAYNTVAKLRVYAGNYLSFSGKTITKIEFAYNSGTTSSTSTTLVRPTKPVTVVEGNGSYVGAVDGSQDALSGYWTGSSSEVTLKWGNQVWFTEIKVTYLEYVPGVASAVEVVDVITAAVTGQTSNNYREWSGVSASSSAVYAGKTRCLNSDMMFKGNDATSRIFTTVSGGFVKSIALNGSYDMNGSDRKFKVYVSHDPFTQTTDLTEATEAGVVTVNQGQTSVLNIDGSWEHFTLARSNGSDANLVSIVVTWSNK